MASRANAVGKRAVARKGATPALEWLLGGVGAVMLLAGVVFLVRDGLSSSDRPGAVEARVIDVTHAGAAFVVRYELANSGDETLSNLRVTARLTEGNREIERASAIIDYLPARSTQRGGFYLRSDPQRYRLEIAPEGYQTP
jgi:uncharacterized protein (TIGR02588 family)